MKSVDSALPVVASKSEAISVINKKAALLYDEMKKL